MVRRGDLRPCHGTFPLSTYLAGIYTRITTIKNKTYDDIRKQS